MVTQPEKYQHIFEHTHTFVGGVSVYLNVPNIATLLYQWCTIAFNGNGTPHETEEAFKTREFWTEFRTCDKIQLTTDEVRANTWMYLYVRPPDGGDMVCACVLSVNAHNVQNCACG